MCPVVLFQKTLNAADPASIDNRDSNQRTALMLAVQAASPDDEAACARQEQKAVMLVRAGANMLLYDEDEETPEDQGDAADDLEHHVLAQLGDRLLGPREVDGAFIVAGGEGATLGRRDCHPWGGEGRGGKRR